MKTLFVQSMVVGGFFLFIPFITHAATITSINPTTITPGTTQVTVTGSGFGAYNSEGDQVCFNKMQDGYTVPFFCTTLGGTDVVSWNDTTIVLKVPSDQNGLMIAGRVHVNVDYTLFDGPYYHIQPAIASVNPSTTFATGKVKLTGKYFNNSLGGTSQYILYVYFNGVAGYVAQSDWSSQGITVQVPKGAATGPVSLKLEMVDGSASVTASGPEVTILTGISDDELSPLQQYLKLINVDKAWGLNTAGKTQIVAVIDDGIYINHPELRNKIWINRKETIGNGKDDDRNGYVDDIYGYNFVLNTDEMTTYDTHGTMVAGIIGAETNNQDGITSINEQVQLMPLAVCDRQLGCSFKAIIKAIRYAVDNGARIINLSLSTHATTGYTTQLNKVIKYAYNHNVVVVAAAGNGDVEGGIGQDLNIIPQSPVCNDQGRNMVVGVGATDSNNYRTTWSNFGTKCVDVYAPGAGIVTTSVPKYNTIVPGEFYGYGDGTSFSAPIVSGAISLLLGKYPHMSVDEVSSRIRTHTANGIIDVAALLSLPYDPPVVEKVKPSTIRIKALSGQATATLTGRDFTKQTAVYIGNTRAKKRFINSKKIEATFPLNKLSYGKNVILVFNKNKHQSIFRSLILRK